MGFCITFGKWNSLLKYILLIALFKFLKDIFFVGVNYRKSFYEIKIPPSNTQKYLSKHIPIHKFICYIFTFIFYSIKNCIKTDTWLGSFCRKFEDSDNNRKKGSKSKVLFIIFLWVGEETLNEIFKGILDLEFWMLGLFFISFLNKEAKLNHHIFSNILIVILCSTVKIILIFIDVNEDDKNDIINKDQKWFIFIGILFYLVIIYIRAYVYINLKTFMNDYFISSSEILILYGLIGTIISLIVCLISTFVECRTDFFKNYICAVPFINGEDYIYNSDIKYFDNFILYFKTLKGEINKKFYSEKLEFEILFEIIVIIVGTILFLFYKYYFIQVINNLSPGHAIFSYSINKIIPKIILPLVTLIKERSFFSKVHEENILLKYILGSINNIFATIGFAIYLEMIILHFCGLDHDIKENINKRMIEDEKKIELKKGINDDGDYEESEGDNEDF